MMKKEKGILLIAVGNPYFGRMAYNLAATIKAAGAIPIAIIYDDSALVELSEEQKKLFDVLISTKTKDGNMNSAMQLRLSLPVLTPFTQTLAIDVDMAWMPGRDPNEVFALLDDRDITYVNEGYYDLDAKQDHTTPMYTGWADPLAIAEAYKLKGKLYQMRGEFLLFKSTPAVKKAFAAAKKIQAKPLIDPRKLGNAVTEEFALNIAFNQAGITPHEDKWQPSYWPLMRGMHLLPVHKLSSMAYALSIGGNIINRSIKSAYDTIVNAAAYKLGLGGMFPLQAKRNYLTERRDA